MAAFVSDTFTDTNGTLVTAHVGGTGAAWAAVTGNTGVQTITSNRAYCSTVIAFHYASGDPASADYEVEAAVRVVTAVPAAAASPIAVAGRMVTSVRTCYLAGIEINSSVPRMRLQSRINNATGTLNNTGVITTPADGSDHILKLRMVGSTISAWWDGVQIITGTSTEITAAGKAGLYGNFVTTPSTGYHIDSITATDLGVAPTPANFALNVPVSLTMTAADREAAALDLAVPVSLTMTAADREAASFALPVPVSLAMTAAGHNGTTVTADLEPYPDAVFTVKPENVTVTIRPENSTATVKAENTSVTVKPENRSVIA